MKNLVKLAAFCIVVTVPGPIRSQSFNPPDPLASRQVHSTYMDVTGKMEEFFRVTAVPTPRRSRMPPFTASSSPN